MQYVWFRTLYFNQLRGADDATALLHIMATLRQRASQAGHPGTPPDASPASSESSAPSDGGNTTTPADVALPTLLDPETCTRKGLCPVTRMRGKSDADPLESHSLYFEQHGSGPEKIVFIMGCVSVQCYDF